MHFEAIQSHERFLKESKAKESEIQFELERKLELLLKLSEQIKEAEEALSTKQLEKKKRAQLRTGYVASQVIDEHVLSYANHWSHDEMLARFEGFEDVGNWGDDRRIKNIFEPNDGTVVQFYDGRNTYVAMNFEGQWFTTASYRHGSLAPICSWENILESLVGYPLICAGWKMLTEEFHDETQDN